jgi:hypothetical protein
MAYIVMNEKQKYIYLQLLLRRKAMKIAKFKYIIILNYFPCNQSDNISILLTRYKDNFLSKIGEKIHFF